MTLYHAFRRSGILVGVFAACLAAAWIGLSLSLTHQAASTVWMPAGIALAVVLWYGYWAAPAAGAAALVVSLPVAGVPTAIVMAAGCAAEAALGAWLLRRFGRGLRTFETAHDVMVYLGLVCVAATAVTAAAGVSALCLIGAAQWTRAGRLWFDWWLGDAGGALVMAPLLILWAEQPRWNMPPRRLAEFAAVLLSIVLISGAVFHGGLATYGLRFLCILPMLWAAYRFGPRETATAVFLLFWICVLMAPAGLSQVPLADRRAAVVLIETFVNVMAAVSLAMAAGIRERTEAQRRLSDAQKELEERVRRRTHALSEANDALRGEIWERGRAERALRASEERFRSLVANIPGAVYRSTINAPRRIVYMSGEALSVSGYTATEFMAGKTWSDLIHHEDLPAATAAFEEAIARRRPYCLEYRIHHAAGGFRWVHDRGCAVFDEFGRPVSIEGVVLDVTESRRAKDAEESRRREEMQKEFVANVSHELRTPVAAIRGFAETLRLGALDDRETALEFIETIERNAERLGRLVEDLLEISVIEAGKRPPRPEAVELAGHIWSFAKDLSPLAEKRKVTLRVDVEPGLRVWADRSQLGQILQNLCDNAIKFNERGGEVLIQARADGAGALVCVRDTGPGIAPELMPHLFERFHGKGRVRRTDHPSTGLGLSIVKSLVEANRGRIWAESSSGGAAFYFVLPQPEARPARVSGQPVAV